MFGNEMPDQVGHDYLVIIGMTWPSLRSLDYARDDMAVIAGLTGNLLLVKCSSNVNGASNA